MIYILVILFLLILLFGIFFYTKYNNLSDINKKLEISLEKIQELVSFKKNKVKEILDIIKEEKYNYRYEHISDNFIEEENEIFILFWDLKKEFKTNKKVRIIVNEVEKYENDLEGLKDYYNCNVNLYNELYKKIPFNLLFKVLKFDNKRAFESKKIEEFEILKD